MSQMLKSSGAMAAATLTSRVLGMVRTRQDRTDEAAESFREGLMLARSLPYPYAEARILAEMGMLEEALAIFQRLGAIKDRERTEEALAALSGTSRPTARCCRRSTLCRCTPTVRRCPAVARP